MSYDFGKCPNCKLDKPTFTCKDCNYYFEKQCYCNESQEFLYAKSDESKICDCFEKLDLNERII